MIPFPLTHTNLGDLDGGEAGRYIDEAIADAVRDLHERGGDGKPRDVNLKIRFTQGDHENEIKVAVHTGHKFPGRATAEHVTKIRTQRGQPVLVFLPEVPDDTQEQQP